MQLSKRILVTVLNWGLGHATRCIPIIRALQEQGATVLLASDGRALHLLKKEFPALKALKLPAYDVHYKSANMIWNMALQIPKISRAIYLEQRAIHRIVKEYAIDAIISDNRFGCYHPTIKTVFITHQINIRIPNPLLQPIIRHFNKKMIQRFDVCWIPDYEGTPNLAYDLAHGHPLLKVQYLGALSRMRSYPREKKYDIVAVLSGPEPQRTHLEKAIITQLKKLPYKALLVRGTTESYHEEQIAPHIESISFLASDDLNDVIMESQVVISRSGYSTIMDLVFLKKPALLIPTPGQTEQVYLATQLEQYAHFCCQTQEGLDISSAMHQLDGCIVCDFSNQGKPINSIVELFLTELTKQL